MRTKKLLLDVEQATDAIQRAHKERPEQTQQRLHDAQVAAYIMCGGGFIGESAATQPASFYIDARVGKLPYPTWKIVNMVKVVKIYAEVLGMNPNLIPFSINCHNACAF